MPRHDGHTANREHRKHGAHRMHRRTSDARRRARVTKRPAPRTWDRVAWLEQHFAETDMDRLIDLVVTVTEPAPVARIQPPEFGRKNHPAKPPVPQKPKEQGRGGRGGKGGKPR